METLFSFELLVDTVKLEIETKVADELAVALRLLDFPTLIIYQPKHKRLKEDREYAFNRGKACFFKINMDALHGHLTSTPLYAMLLDVKEDIPKFVGSSLISLAQVMARIKADVTERGVSTPSSHGQRGSVVISNLKGEKVGTMLFSYKLLSLGCSLLPHMSDKVDSHKANLCLEDKIGVKEVHELRTNSDNVHKSDQDVSSQLTKVEESKQTKRIFPESKEFDSHADEDMGVFCPPCLYYNNSAEERRRCEDESCKQLESNVNAYKCEVTQDEIDQSLHGQRPNATITSQEKTQVSTGDVTPNVIGQALRQMPLLNALLVELSQLNSSNSNQPLSIHPNLSWIYRPASTESTAVQRKISPNESKRKLACNTKSKDLYSPRRCSTPKQEETKITLRKKLVYGTTKSFNLRLKQNFPVGVKQRECMELFERKTQQDTSQDNSKKAKKQINSTKTKSSKDSKLIEKIESMMQNITVCSTPQESIIEQREDVEAAAGSIWTSHGDTSIIEKSLPIESPLRLMRIPANVANDNRAKVNQSSPDSHSGKCSGSRSRRSSTDSSLSDCSRGEEDYDDDFNSFETSVAFSPDPTSPSLGLRRPKTASDLGTPQNSSPESYKTNRRPVIPVPIKAAGSPRRALRGTYTIQRQQVGVSFSSEDEEAQQAFSKPSLYLDRSREESSGDSLRSMGDLRSESKSRQSIKRFSDESSFEDETEKDDRLGSVDFRKGYKHISELVANKLPGYTM
ncbi:unnamed protein product [Knipowitschia caucasica]